MVKRVFRLGLLVSLCLMFLGPILYGVKFAWKNHVVQTNIRTQSLLDLAGHQILADLDTRRYLSHLLQLLAKRAAASDRPKTLLKNGFAQLKRRFPGVFRFVVIDAEGRIVSSISDDRSGRQVLEAVYLRQRQFHRTAGGELGEFAARIRQGIGALCEPILLSHQRKSLFPVSEDREDRFLSYYVTPRFGLYSFATQTEAWEDLALDDRCRRWMKHPSHRALEVGWISLDHTGSRNFPQDSDVMKGLAAFRQTGRAVFAGRYRIYRFFGIRPGRFLWGSLPIPASRLWWGWVILFGTISGLLLIKKGVVSVLDFVEGKRVWWSIRGQIAGLFCVAGGLPLLVLTAAGYDYLGEHALALEEGKINELSAELESIDHDFALFRGNLETSLRKAISVLSMATPAAEEQARTCLSELRTRFRFSRLYVYDRQGRCRWTSDGQKPSGRDARLFGKVAAHVMAEINGDGKAVFDPAALVLGGIMGTQDPRLEISRNLGHLFRIMMSDEQRCWTFFLPLRDSSGDVGYLVRGFWSENKLDRLFVEQALALRRERMPAVSFQFLDQNQQEWITSGLPDATALRAFAVKVGRDGARAGGRWRHCSAWYLAAGRGMSEVRGGILTAFLPMRVIEEAVRFKEKLMWGFNGLMVMMCLFIGYLLALRFLRPIAEIDGGMKAIHARHFQYRLPPGGNDEFGDVMRFFNQALAGLADLDVARIIQESLFQTDVIRAGEYGLFGACSSAAELGGDYFDGRLLPDGRLFFLLGDVSGHGIPAALIMAMAKSICEREISRGAGVDTVLLPFHRLLIKVFNRRYMMTCFLGVIDPEQHTLTFANSGHCFPVLFRDKGQGEPLRVGNQANAPLGSLGNLRLTVRTIPFGPGEKLFLFSDGLAEAERLTGGIVGFEALCSGVGALLDEDPQASCRRVAAWHQSLVGDGPREDDITIAVLCRQALFEELRLDDIP